MARSSCTPGSTGSASWGAIDVTALPRLDDRTYDDLLAEARALIPAHAPEWTDHNASDPGIALLELFAWIAEMLIFRADQVTDRHVMAFVRLLRGPDWTPDPARTVAAEVDAALAELREPWRAVTPADFARIAATAAPERIARVECAPRRDLSGAKPDADVPGTLSVVVLPALDPTVRIVDADKERVAGMPLTLSLDADKSLWIGAASAFGGVRFALDRAGSGYDLRVAYFDGVQLRPFKPDDGTQGLTRSGTMSFVAPTGWAPGREGHFWLRVSVAAAPSRAARATRIAPVMPQPDTSLATVVRGHLEPRRILATRPVVVGPLFVPVSIDALVAARADADVPALRREVFNRLDAYLDPMAGGPAGTGWPLGRSLFLGELYALLDGVPEVDHVPDIGLGSAAGTPLAHPNGDPVGLAIGANRLPDARVDESAIVVGTSFVSVRAEITIEPADGADVPALRAALKRAVRAFYHPLSGGPAGGPAGDWPVADLERKLRAVPGVARLVAATLTTNPDRITYDAQLPVLSLRENELVDVDTDIREG